MEKITQHVSKMSQQVLIASMIFYVPNVINRKLNSYFIENMPLAIRRKWAFD